MDKIIVTAFLIMAGVISSIFAFNSIFPAVVSSGDAMTSMERRLDERMKSQIQIINVAKSGNLVMIWVKNIGSLRILAPDSCDVFFGPQGNYSRIPFGQGTPYWGYSFENNTQWNPTATMRITVDYTSAVAPGSGTYYAKVVLSNGSSDEYLVSW